MRLSAHLPMKGGITNLRKDQGDIESRIKRLEDIEAIKQLKAKYWRCVDMKRWDELTECFTEDATADFGPEIKLEGGKEIAEFLKKAFEADTVIVYHSGHRPEIKLTGDNTAKGMWWTSDFIIMPPNIRRRDYAYHEDEYVKINGEWKKKHTKANIYLGEWGMVKH